MLFSTHSLMPATNLTGTAPRPGLVRCIALTWQPCPATLRHRGPLVAPSQTPISRCHLRLQHKRWEAHADHRSRFGPTQGGASETETIGSTTIHKQAADQYCYFELAVYASLVAATASQRNSLEALPRRCNCNRQGFDRWVHTLAPLDPGRKPVFQPWV